MAHYGKVKYPIAVVRGVAMKSLLEQYEANPAFSKERDSVYQQYRSVLPATMRYILNVLREKGVLFLEENTPLNNIVMTGLATKVMRTFEQPEAAMKYLQKVPQANQCFREYIGLCLRYGLDYEWAPWLLFCEDMVKEYGPDSRVSMSIGLSLLTGIEPFTAIILPSSVVYLEKRERIHKFVDLILDEIPRDSSWKDSPHGLKLHVGWLYAYKAKKMTYAQISDDPDLNSTSTDGWSPNPQQIGRAVRTLDRLLGGAPRSRGRPAKSK